MFNTLFTIYTVFWYSLSRCMCVTWSWRTCILAFGFALNSGCDRHSLPVQRPVYYISEVLSESKARYPQIQKPLYAVVLARRKLQHYFKVHPVTVVSSFPVDGVYSYQTSYGFASRQIPRRSQGTLLPSSGEPKVSNPWNNVQSKDLI
jgi:hypothetical protein